MTDPNYVSYRDVERWTHEPPEEDKPAETSYRMLAYLSSAADGEEEFWRAIKTDYQDKLPVS